MSFYNDAQDDANQYLNQIPGTVSPYYQPYINAGGQALGSLGNQISSLLGGGSSLMGSYGSMLSDPSGYMNSLGAGYQESPGYQAQLNQGLQASDNAAAAGGYTGDPQNQYYDDQVSEGLANKDYYNYLDHALKVAQMGAGGMQSMYNTGFHGLEDINNMGFQPSSDLAQALAQVLNEQGQLSYASDINKNQQKGGLIGDTLGFAGSLARDLF